MSGLNINHHHYVPATTRHVQCMHAHAPAVLSPHARSPRPTRPLPSLPAIVSHATPHARSPAQLLRSLLLHAHIGHYWLGTDFTHTFCLFSSAPALDSRFLFICVSYPCPTCTLPYALAVFARRSPPPAHILPSSRPAHWISRVLSCPFPTAALLTLRTAHLGPPNYLRTPSPPRLALGRTCIRRTRTRIRPLY